MMILNFLTEDLADPRLENITSPVDPSIKISWLRWIVVLKRSSHLLILPSESADCDGDKIDMPLHLHSWVFKLFLWVCNKPMSILLQAMWPWQKYFSSIHPITTVPYDIFDHEDMLQRCLIKSWVQHPFRIAVSIN